MNSLILFYYHLLWTCLVVFSLPLSLFHKRLGLADRLRIYRPPKINKGRNIWIHALSVGEVLSAVPLIKMLKERYPHYQIIFTVKTRSGLDTARNLTDKTVDYLLPMPLDFWWSVHSLCRAINPRLYILVETDLWPGTIGCVKRRQIPVILVNGRISPRTYKSHKKYAWIMKRIWESLDVCLMQTEIDRQRLLDIGVSPAKVKTTGNIKFDQDWEEMDRVEKEWWYQALKLRPEDRTWVAGSLHEGECEPILEAFEQTRAQFPDLRLIMAPRRLEWGEEISLACRRRGLSCAVKTALSENEQDYQVLILDTIGELRRVYGLAEFSFVGGSLVPVGGHNLLEPASFGQPVLFGPYTHNFELMARRLIENGGGLRVKEGEVLAKTVKELLLDPASSRKMGLAARDFVKSNRGALKLIQKEIENSLAIS